MSQSHKGVPLSVDHRKAIIEARKGSKNLFYRKKHSPETRKKMSDAQKGPKHYNYGKKLSQNTKKKISDSLKGYKHYNYNPNREEVYADYGGDWYDLKEEYIKYLMEEQGGRVVLTGNKIKPGQLIHRHHINYDKNDHGLDNLVLLTAGSHAAVSHYGSKREIYKKIFEVGKKALKEGNPPKYWSNSKKKQFQGEKKRQTDLIEF